MPLDPEMIIAVQLSRSCTSVRVFAVFAFSRFAARFRVFVVFAVFAFSRFAARFRVFARKCRASPEAETHTFPAQASQRVNRFHDKVFCKVVWQVEPLSYGSFSVSRIVAPKNKDQ